MAANPQDDSLHGIPMTEEAFEYLVSVESPTTCQEGFGFIVRVRVSWQC